MPESSFLVGAFTHKASNIVNGTTLHHLLGIDVKTRKFHYKLIKSYVNAGITHIFIHEVSMVPSWIWNILAHIKREYGFIFIGCGDWKQLAPVEEEHLDFENSWIVKYLFSRNVYQGMTIWRFNEDELLQGAHAVSDGGKIDFATFGTTTGPYPGNQPLEGNALHEYADGTYTNSMIGYRTELQQRLMNKNSNREWQQRIAPIYRNQQTKGFMGTNSSKSYAGPRGG